MTRTRRIRSNRLQTGIAALLCMAVGGVGCTPSISDKDIKPISIGELKALTDSPERATTLLLVDPRPPQEYQALHIAGAVNMPLTDVSGVPKDTDPAITKFPQIVVYGHDPASPPARAMTKRMLATGYENVRMYFGGLVEWNRLGYPTETGPKPWGDAAAATGQ
ncbi:MAG: rhodanese-like domain-containing protein [Phycisphaeraceae bacterium]|nr:rhodanese-like domain-containing protein [Phycisphaeraceae bacterium]